MQAQVAREVDRPDLTWLPPSGGPRPGMMQHSYLRPGISRQNAALLQLCAELTYLKACGSEETEPAWDERGLPPRHRSRASPLQHLLNRDKESVAGVGQGWQLTRDSQGVGHGRSYASIALSEPRRLFMVVLYQEILALQVTPPWGGGGSISICLIISLCAGPAAKKRKVADAWADLLERGLSSPNWPPVLAVMLQRHGHATPASVLQVTPPLPPPQTLSSHNFVLDCCAYLPTSPPPL